MEATGSPPATAVAEDAGSTTATCDEANQMVLKDVRVFDAARTGDVELLKEILMSGQATVLDRDEEENANPLHWAAAYGMVDTCRYLIGQGADMHALDGGDATPLHRAASFGSVDVCRCLIDHGAEVDALGGSVSSTPLQWASRESHTGVIRLLLAHNADVNLADTEGSTALHYAVNASSVISLLYLLQQLPTVDAQDAKTATPLMYAAREGNDVFMGILIRHGANPNARCDENSTPLHWAAHGGHSNCIRRLLANNVDLNALNDDGHPPVVTALLNNKEEAWVRVLGKIPPYDNLKYPQDWPLTEEHTISAYPSSSTKTPESFVPSDVFEKYAMPPESSQGSRGILDAPFVPSVDSDLPINNDLLNAFMSRTEDLQLSVSEIPSDIEELIVIGQAVLWAAHNKQTLMSTTVPSSMDLVGILRDLSWTDVQTHATLLRRLSTCYGYRYRKTEDVNDIDVAIAICRTCIDVNMEDIPCDEVLLCTLFTAKFERTQNLETIMDAVMHGREGLQGIYQDHPMHLFRSAMALWARFTRYRIEDDLDNSIALFRASIRATEGSSGADFSHQLYIGLTRALSHKISHTDQPGLVADECISTLREQLANCQPDESYYVSYQGILAFALRWRYLLVSNDFSDLDEAILIGGQIVDYNFSSVEVTWKQICVSMWDLAMSFTACHEHRKSVEDIDMAIDLLELMYSESKDPDSLEITMREALMALAHLWRYEVTKDPNDLEASNKYLCDYEDDFAGIDAWMSLIIDPAFIHHEEKRYAAAVIDYRKALEFFPLYLMIGRDYRMLANIDKRCESLSANAAAASAACGRYGDALELLELGRAMGWSRGLQMRSELQQLEIDHPEYARDFGRLSKSLEKVELMQSMLQTSRSSKIQALLQYSPLEQRRLNESKRWQELLAKIRTLDGYENFLSKPRYDQLKCVSQRGPVVVINVSKYRSDAFILTQSTLDRPQIVRLSDNLHDLSKEWADNLLDGINKMKDGVMRDYDFRRIFLGPVLYQLWKQIVQPIRDSLNFLAPYSQRIWWVPTRWLTFLPLHLVTNGLYGDDTPLDMIPSYVTTLSSLLRTKSSLDRYEPVNILSVGCGLSDGYVKIPGARKEVGALADITMGHGIPIHVLQSSNATVERVLTSMPESTWSHLACHGIQSLDRPYTSHFALATGSLHLAEIAGLRLQNAQFAFLSACHTASGVPSLCDEAMHLAAGLQFAGFCSIIATMWSVHDKTAKKMAEEVYRFLFRNLNERPLVEDAAEALWKATRTLRAQGVPLSRLAPFIHMGV